MLSLQLILQLFGLATIAQSKLVLHDAIFLATCVAMALRDKLQVECSVYFNLSRNFLGLQRLHTIAQSKLV